MDEFVNAKMIREIFKSTDKNHNGNICFKEFVSAERQRELLKAFNDIDHSRNGYISKTEALEFISDKVKKIKEIFKKADVNGNEKLSFEDNYLLK